MQIPLFISFFIGLRKMAQLPVESMTMGGLAWFTDLTIYDPYYVLPISASLTMLATIEVGICISLFRYNQIILQS